MKTTFALNYQKTVCLLNLMELAVNVMMDSKLMMMVLALKLTIANNMDTSISTTNGSLMKPKDAQKYASVVKKDFISIVIINANNCHQTVLTPMKKEPVSNVLMDIN